MGNGKNLPQHGILKTNPQLAMLKDFTERNLRRQPCFNDKPNSLWGNNSLKKNGSKQENNCRRYKRKVKGQNQQPH